MTNICFIFLFFFLFLQESCQERTLRKGSGKYVYNIYKYILVNFLAEKEKRMSNAKNKTNIRHPIYIYIYIVGLQFLGI